MMDKNRKAYLKSLISKDRLKETIDALAKDFPGEKTILLQQQFKSLQHKSNLGLYSQDDIQIKRNQFANQLLYFIDYPNQKWPPPDVSLKRSYSRLSIIGGVFLLILLFWWSYPILFPSSFTQTLLVRDQADQMVIENRGMLLVQVGNDTKELPIGTNGTIHFREIPAHLAKTPIKVVLKDIRDYQLAPLLNPYTLNQNQPITIRVQRPNKISGTVWHFIEDDTPIDSALVVINQDTALTTRTNTFGKFEFELPPHKTKEVYQVLIQKKGFVSSTENLTTGSGNPDIFLKPK